MITTANFIKDEQKEKAPVDNFDYDAPPIFEVFEPGPDTPVIGVGSTLVEAKSSAIKFLRLEGEAASKALFMFRVKYPVKNAPKAGDERIIERMAKVAERKAKEKLANMPPIDPAADIMEIGI